MTRQNSVAAMELGFEILPLTSLLTGDATRGGVRGIRQCGSGLVGWSAARPKYGLQVLRMKVEAFLFLFGGPPDWQAPGAPSAPTIVYWGS